MGLLVLITAYLLGLVGSFQPFVCKNRRLMTYNGRKSLIKHNVAADAGDEGEGKRGFLNRVFKRKKSEGYGSGDNDNPMTFDEADADYLSPSPSNEGVPKEGHLPPPSRQGSNASPSTPPMSDADKQAYVDMVNDPYRFVRGPKPRREDKVIRQKLPLRGEEASAGEEEDGEAATKEEGSKSKDSRPPASSAWSSTVSRTLDTLGNKSHMPADKMDDEAKRAFVEMVNDPNRFARGGKKQDPPVAVEDEGARERKDPGEVINFRPPAGEEGGVDEGGASGGSVGGTDYNEPPADPPAIAPITPSDSFISGEPPIDPSKMDLSQRLEVAAIAEEGRLREIKRIRAEQEKLAKIQNDELRKKEAERISELNRLRELEVSESRSGRRRGRRKGRRRGRRSGRRSARTEVTNQC